MRRTKSEAAETREAIIDAAEETFLELGLSKASLSNIAQRANVTRGAIYFHFKDKNEIIHNMISRVRFPEEELIEETENNDSIDPLDILTNSCLICLKSFVDDPHQQRVMTIIARRCKSIDDNSEISKRMHNAHAGMLDLFERMLKMAQKRNMLSQNWQPHDGARAIVSTMHGLLIEWLESNNDFLLKQVGEQTIRAIINSMRIKNI